MKPLFNLYLLVFLFLTSVTYAQEHTVTGAVKTLENIAVVNAEVKVLSSKVIVLTDSVGKFEVSCLNNDKLKIGAKGFYSRKVKIDANTENVLVNLKFKPGDNNINIALGYGHISEKDKSYAISQIGTVNNLEFSKYSNVLDHIVNSSPSIIYGGGGIIIRGSDTLKGSSAALILLDGISVSASSLSMLAPADVKSIDIMKDGSAAIYGSRGANGVIIITTKRGGDGN